MPNFRMNARGRPQGRSTHTTGQRFSMRELNRGVRNAFAICDFFAIFALLPALAP